MPWTNNVNKRSMLSMDMVKFRILTQGGALIMGRLTFESMGSVPLVGRLSIVVTKQQPDQQNDDRTRRVANASSLEEAIVLAKRLELAPWVVGGVGLIQEAMARHDCERVYITKVARAFDHCTVFFPVARQTELLLFNGFSLVGVSEMFATDQVNEQFPDVFVYQIQEWGKGEKLGLSPVMLHPHPEMQYLNLLREVLTTGSERGDRTGTGVRSLFQRSMRFDLSSGKFPLLTTKKVSFKTVVKELLWIVSGCTDVRVLEAQGVSIWTGNSSRGFLDAQGLTAYQVGDIGPAYGFQLRHSGATYEGCEADYTGKGVDQLAEVIRLIKEDPRSRRILFNLWNVSDLKKMALPPCAMMAQFYVDKGRLSCAMYQRSADLFLGVPFNIASYSLLTCMIAQVCNLEVGEFVHHLGDVHLYSTHFGVVQEQLDRVPSEWPCLVMDPRVKDIDEFRVESVDVVGYRPGLPLRAVMAV